MEVSNASDTCIFFFWLLLFSLTLPFEAITPDALAHTVFTPNQIVCYNRLLLPGHKDRGARDEDQANGPRSPYCFPPTAAKAALCPPRATLWALKLRLNYVGNARSSMNLNGLEFQILRELPKDKVIHL